MTLLIDDLPRFGTRVPNFMVDEDMTGYKITMETIMPIIEKAPTYNISEICEYMYSVHGAEFWGTEDWPNMTPPSENFWMEMHRPSRVYIEDKGVADVSHWVKRWGFIFRTAQLEDGCWEYSVHMFCQAEPKMFSIGPVCEWHFFVEPDGRMSRYPEYWTASSQSWTREVKEMLEMFNHMIWPCMLAICMLNCKNVETESLLPSDKLQKSYTRKHGHPLRPENVLRVHKVMTLDGNGYMTSPDPDNQWNIHKSNWARRGEESDLLWERENIVP